LVYLLLALELRRRTNLLQLFLKLRIHGDLCIQQCCAKILDDIKKFERAAFLSIRIELVHVGVSVTYEAEKR